MCGFFLVCVSVRKRERERGRERERAREREREREYERERERVRERREKERESAQRGGGGVERQRGPLLREPFLSLSLCTEKKRNRFPYALTGNLDDDESAEEALPDQQRRGDEAQRERVCRVAEPGSDRREERREHLHSCFLRLRRGSRSSRFGLRPARAGAARRGGHLKGLAAPGGEQAASQRWKERLEESDGEILWVFFQTERENRQRDFHSQFQLAFSRRPPSQCLPRRPLAPPQAHQN